MNGIEKIIDHIKAESDAECRTIAKEAEKKSAEIEKQYEKAALEEYGKLTEKGEKDAALHIERLGHVASLEAKKKVLTVKQELVSKSFERAAEQLVSLPEADYIALLTRLAAEASRTGNEEIVLNKNDRERVGAAVCDKANNALKERGKAAGLKLSNQTRSMRGGLILVSGDIEVNCSIDALISQYKNELSSKVAAVLFN